MSNYPPTNKQELYDRIAESSKDEVILEEMIRLGYWPTEGNLPHDPADEIKRKGVLERELGDLAKQQSKLNDIEAIKKEARLKRMKESKERQKENKEKREKERLARAQKWAEAKAKDIVFLGPKVSGGLNDKSANTDRLKQNGLPILADAEALAKAMGISVGQLRFLAFDRKTAQTSHYVRFKLPKKTGGERLISAPLPRLKTAQRWILDNVLSKVEVHDAAHGFRLSRSILSNAKPHVGQDVVVNIDLSDFFPTVTYRRVKGLFKALGYSEATATIMALICSEPEVISVELDGQTFHVAQTERRLPQGAPTSPAVTNVLCRRLDRRLERICKKLGFVYTRYADDLTFSASGEAARQVGRLLRQVRYTVAQEGFVVHPKKTRVLRKSRCQEVTGVVVNEKPGVPRKTLRAFRATLFQIEKDGPDGKKWGHCGDVLASCYGFAGYVAMIDPEKGAPLVKRAKALLDKHGKKTPRPTPKAPPPQPAAAKPAAPKVADAPQAQASKQAPKNDPAKAPEDAKKPWWKFW